MHRITFLPLAAALAIACRASDACESCAISAERIAVFGGAEGEGALADRPLVSAAFGGRRIVLQPDANQAMPLLFSEAGRFLSVIGRAGSGPGEFRSPFRVLVDADSAWIVDIALRRAAAVSPRGEVGATVTWLRPPYDAILWDEGSWIVAAGHGAGRALTHVAASGEILREFGQEFSSPLSLPRWHIARNGRRFWAASATHRLQFEEWAGPDSLVRVVTPVTAHFPPYSEQLPATPDRPPQSNLRGFWTDSLARIWALLEVPGADWLSGYGPARVGEGGRTYMPVVDANRALSAVILVIDPATGLVIAERVLEGWFYHVVEPFVILRAVQDADGWYRGEAWRVGLRQP